MPVRRRVGDDADVVVVGGGPAGAATAAWCARYGLDVVVLDKATFPRDKVCGDGLTPRAVAELQRLEVDTTGWHRVTGLRLVSGDHEVEVPWPQVSTSADHGLVRPRTGLDDALLAHARTAGARVHEGWAARRLVQDAAGRTVGVAAQQVAGAASTAGDRPGTSSTPGPGAVRGGRQAGGATRTWRAPVVVEATGVAARLAVAAGRERASDRPLGVAVRGYLATARHDDRWMESHLELWSGEPGRSQRLPGYGWVFPAGDGTANVGLGTVHSSPARQSAAGVDHRRALEAWTTTLADRWGSAGPGAGAPVLSRLHGTRAAALPMAFNRTPLYADGLLLVGDAGGMVSPFNGEGIAYALMAGRIAAHSIATARRSPADGARERELGRYAEAVRAELGGYFSLGRVFVRLIENPAVMHWCTRYGVRHEALLRAVVRLLADAYEPRGGDLVDRTIATLARLAPRA